jgi:orotidine-5'-phosphate decarboxylase
MTRAQLEHIIKEKQSFLCVGLDTDINNIPEAFLQEEDPIFAFNKCIIDATLPYAVSYKINTAFYESLGVKGWQAMEKTVRYLPNDVFKIADAKRGDIGNTSAQYAKAFFETLPFDAITVSPYMGSDSLQPFYSYANKWVIILAITSNKGALDFETLDIKNTEQKLFERVIETTSQWGNAGNTMYVVGATQLDYLAKARAAAPDHYFLVPGVGAQGGSLQEVAAHCIHSNAGVIVNISRAIIYSSKQKDSLAIEAAEIAKQYQFEMQQILSKKV